MNWQIVMGLITAVGSLGWLAALLQFRSQNRKTIAEADEIVQKRNRMIFDQMTELLDITKADLADCRRRLAACQDCDDEAGNE